MRLTKIHLAAILIVLVAAGVATFSFLARETRIPPDATFEIELERTACFGTCPVYSVTINQDGQVVYSGEAFVQTTGEHHSQISSAKVGELRRAVERIDFFKLKDRYTEMGATDMPSAILQLTLNGRTKIVEHYFGDFDAPQALFELETEIDRITNSAQWTEFIEQ